MRFITQQFGTRYTFQKQQCPSSSTANQNFDIALKQGTTSKGILITQEGSSVGYETGRIPYGQIVTGCIDKETLTKLSSCPYNDKTGKEFFEKCPSPLSGLWHI